MRIAAIAAYAFTGLLAGVGGYVLYRRGCADQLHRNRELSDAALKSAFADIRRLSATANYLSDLLAQREQQLEDMGRQLGFAPRPAEVKPS